MYNTEGLSSTARIKLDSLLYAGIIREIESILFIVNALGVDNRIHEHVSAIGELVTWYYNNIKVSGDYLKSKFDMLKQVIRLKSSM